MEGGQVHFRNAVHLTPVVEIDRLELKIRFLIHVSIFSVFLKFLKTYISLRSFQEKISYREVLYFFFSACTMYILLCFAVFIR